MKPQRQEYGDWLLGQLADARLSERAVVVLIGSAARGVATWRSDIDLLIVFSGDERLNLRPPIEMHLQQESRTHFLQRIYEGDDYPVWALLCGKALHDPDGWWARAAADERAHPHTPDWTPKVARAEKSLKWAGELLDAGDADAFEEQCLYAASHLARAVLLKRGVMPLSRPEMADQVRESNPELAWVLNELAQGDLPHERAVAVKQAMRSASISSGRARWRSSPPAETCEQTRE